MKNSNDTIGNRTGDLPARSAVPQPPRTPLFLNVTFLLSSQTSYLRKYVYELLPLLRSEARLAEVNQALQVHAVQPISSL